MVKLDSRTHKQSSRTELFHKVGFIVTLKGSFKNRSVVVSGAHLEDSLPLMVVGHDVVSLAELIELGHVVSAHGSVKKRKWLVTLRVTQGTANKYLHLPTLTRSCYKRRDREREKESTCERE